MEGIIQMDVLAILAAVTAFLVLVFAYSLSSWVGKTNEGTERIKELAGFIRESAMTFLKRESKVMIPVILILFIIIGFAINWTAAALYILGVLYSMLSGFFGLRTAVTGSMRTANAAANEGMSRALVIAFRSGAVMGLCTAGLGLLGLGGVFVVLGIEASSVITGFGLGVSTAALFGCTAGGIFARAAAACAVLIGKAEAGVSEGDPRNPAAIVDYSGNYISRALGMCSDRFESYVGSIIAAIVIAAATRVIKPTIGYPFDLPALEGTVFPLFFSAVTILAAIAGIMFVRGNEKLSPASAINTGKYLTNVITGILTIILSYAFFGNLNCAISIIIGMLTGAVTGKITNTYTTGNSRRLKKIAEQSQAGYLMIGEYGVGMLSVLWPMTAIAVCVLAADGFADYYGVALAAVGMLSTTALLAAIDTYGPISRNAGEISRMARLSEEARTITDKLNAAGSSSAATGKGFASGAAVLTAVALFLSYAVITELKAINLTEPYVIACLLAGAMLPVLFAAMTMNASGKTAAKMLENVKRQFHSDAGIMAGASKPDYAKCADTGAKAALKGLAAPGLLALVIPPAFGILGGTEALGGLLIGAMTAGALTSAILSNTGGTWNHEEKYISGDPFKGAAAVSVNVFIKLLAMESVVFAPLFAAIGGLLR
jgi:K(+)-stimulated pyrophosphate-energized sodium pump